MKKIKTVKELIEERYRGNKTEKIRQFAEDWDESFTTVCGWYYGRELNKKGLILFNIFDNLKTAKKELK